jgi:hypothetical protein
MQQHARTLSDHSHVSLCTLSFAHVVFPPHRTLLVCACGVGLNTLFFGLACCVLEAGLAWPTELAPAATCTEGLSAAGMTGAPGEGEG